MHKQIILAFLLVGSTGIGAAVQLPSAAELNGAWDEIVADRFGFLWASGSDGVRRFDVRVPSAGWYAFPSSKLPEAPTAARLSRDIFSERTFRLREE